MHHVDVQVEELEGIEHSLHCGGPLYLIVGVEAEELEKRDSDFKGLDIRSHRTQHRKPKYDGDDGHG